MGPEISSFLPHYYHICLLFCCRNMTAPGEPETGMKKHMNIIWDVAKATAVILLIFIFALAAVAVLRGGSEPGRHHGRGLEEGFKAEILFGEGGWDRSMRVDAGEETEPNYERVGGDP
jgi:hypothetical protein